MGRPRPLFNVMHYHKRCKIVGVAFPLVTCIANSYRQEQHSHCKFAELLTQHFVDHRQLQSKSRQLTQHFADLTDSCQIQDHIKFLLPILTLYHFIKPDIFFFSCCIPSGFMLYLKVRACVKRKAIQGLHIPHTAHTHTHTEFQTHRVPTV